MPSGAVHPNRGDTANRGTIEISHRVPWSPVSWSSPSGRAQRGPGARPGHEFSARFRAHTDRTAHVRGPFLRNEPTVQKRNNVEQRGTPNVTSTPNPFSAGPGLLALWS